jgi:DNA-binding NarL/FixJ family response regulator
MEWTRMKPILIIENSPHFRRALREALDTHIPGASIVEASDGEEAWQRIKEAAPRMVFVDIRLPGINGLKLTKEIKKRHPQIIVAMLTSYDLPEYRSAAFNYGADHFVLKDALTAKDIVVLADEMLSRGLRD